MRRSRLPLILAGLALASAACRPRPLPLSPARDAEALFAVTGRDCPDTLLALERSSDGRVSCRAAAGALAVLVSATSGAPATVSLVHGEPGSRSLQGIEGLACSGMAEWSPDGRTLAVLGWKSGQPEVPQPLAVDGASGQVLELAPVELRAQWLAWSPDSRWIAVVARPEGPSAPAFNAWMIALGERRRHELTSDLRAGLPAWSPDGARLAVPDVVQPVVHFFDTHGRQLADVPVQPPADLARPTLLAAAWPEPARLVLAVRDGEVGSSSDRLLELALPSP